MNAKFVKVMSPEQAAAETKGWHAVRNVLRVPHLLGWNLHERYHTVVYEDVFANGRCEHLLGDCIALADHGLTDGTPVQQLVAGACADLVRSVAQHGEQAALADSVTTLHAPRLRRGGRLDLWYAPDSILNIGGTRVTVADLAAFELVVNGERRRLDITAIIEQSRQRLHLRSCWMTALTQGDPTEPNIAYPKTWLDFEHAGRNILAADVANLLWYLLGMGGWLVPKYQPDVYQRTLRHRLPPVTTPVASHLEVSQRHRRIDVGAQWRVGPGRAAALETLTAQLRGQLGQACTDGSADLLGCLRPFLVTRILGVIHLATLDGMDTALCLAKLAQLQDLQTGLGSLLADLVVHPGDSGSLVCQTRVRRSCSAKDSS
ncbi:hypothetical protein JQS43_22060 [Natronosporangium hydrolyticum]|uniref:Uncharacterized protein n=1 Tax=Natronosporangium hydrolyticum TaxID=2811111 RepID=A0A895YK38_9ACTN|nr:hypothetical protein [Natronosporangium hydrolyticum]QSB14178.1 hypothetical protein JQS43_22060 [Natronosporangium hydrolyticum]